MYRNVARVASCFNIIGLNIILVNVLLINEWTLELTLIEWGLDGHSFNPLPSLWGTIHSLSIIHLKPVPNILLKNKSIGIKWITFYSLKLSLYWELFSSLEIVFVKISGFCLWIKLRFIINHLILNERFSCGFNLLIYILLTPTYSLTYTDIDNSL